MYSEKPELRTKTMPIVKIKKPNNFVFDIFSFRISKTPVCRTRRPRIIDVISLNLGKRIKNIRPDKYVPTPRYAKAIFP